MKSTTRSGKTLVRPSTPRSGACLAKAEMEFALMANVTLRGACLPEADMSGAQLDAAVLTGTDLRKANLRGVGFRHARLDAADLGLVVRSWSGRRCGVPICAVRICAWRGSTVQMCPMPIWRAWKA